MSKKIFAESKKNYFNLTLLLHLLQKNAARKFEYQPKLRMIWQKIRESTTEISVGEVFIL
jgi:hypothetical protein